LSRRAILLAACGSVLGGAAAHAVVTTCSTAFYAWPSNFTPSTTTSGPASAAANDTLFNTYKLPNKAYTYFAQGPKLYCYRNVDEGSTGHNFNGGAPDDCATNPADCAAGTVKWAWTSSADAGGDVSRSDGHLSGVALRLHARRLPEQDQCQRRLLQFGVAVPVGGHASRQSRHRIGGLPDRPAPRHAGRAAQRLRDG